MNQQVPDVELRFAELQTQIDRLTVSLQRWQQAHERPNPSEARLTELVERCATTIDHWMALDARHEQVVTNIETRLNDWSVVESRIEQDSDRRVRQFEQFLEQEGEAIRTLHAQPVKQLREQAANLEETCIAAANLALRGFERAEQRLAALEVDLQNRLNLLTVQVEEAIAQLRGGQASHGRSLPSGSAPFPLESVMRIHDEVRRANRTQHEGAGSIHDTAAERSAIPPAAPARQLPAANGAPPTDADARGSAHGFARESVPSKGSLGIEAKPRDGVEPPPGFGRASLIAIGVAILALVLLAFQLQRRVDARLDDASNRVAAAEQRAEEARATASREIANTRDAAERNIAEARQSARQAEIVSQVLAAPDLVRYNLGGTTSGSRAYAQLLWSRSRGFVFSGSRLAAPPDGSTYQLWLYSAAGATSAGTFAPDAAGRVSLAIDEPPNVRRPLSGMAVTVEKAGGAAEPLGTVVLTRVQ